MTNFHLANDRQSSVNYVGWFCADVRTKSNANKEGRIQLISIGSHKKLVLFAWRINQIISKFCISSREVCKNLQWNWLIFRHFRLNICFVQKQNASLRLKVAINYDWSLQWWMMLLQLRVFADLLRKTINLTLLNQFFLPLVQFREVSTLFFH